jgi:hypothetical protein
MVFPDFVGRDSPGRGSAAHAKAPGSPRETGRSMDVPAVLDSELGWLVWPLGKMREGLNRRDSATRPIGTFPEIWPGCFGWRARLRGVFQQLAEIGSDVGQRGRRRLTLAQRKGTGYKGCLCLLLHPVGRHHS